MGDSDATMGDFDATMGDFVAPSSKFSSKSPTLVACVCRTCAIVSLLRFVLRKKPTKVAIASDVAIKDASSALPTENSDMAAIWQQVLGEYLARLSTRDRHYCVALPSNATITEVTLEQTFKPLRQKYEKDGFHRFLKRVGSISDHVLSFGRAIDVSVGGGAFGAGLLWGGIQALLLASSRTMSLHGKVLDCLESLSRYLTLFERWTKLFPTADFTELGACIKETCTEFFAFTVEAIKFFRGSAFITAVKVTWHPGFERRFQKCYEKIEKQTKHLDREVNTAGLESSLGNDQTILKLLEQSTTKPALDMTVSLPVRFMQNAPRNDQFFGREHELTELDKYFAPNASSTPTRLTSVLIHGLGGCGKSSIAKEYMYRQCGSGRYAVILWIYAETSDKLETQFINIARQLGLKAVESGARHSVLTWINNLDQDFLIVFDNADDTSRLSKYWPNSIRGSILITSRSPMAKEEGFAQHEVQLKAFEEREGLQFLKSIIPPACDIDDEDKSALETVSRNFGGLPLALQQAGSFMKAKKCGPAKFLKIYQQNYEVIDQFKVEFYDKSIATTWSVSTSGLSEHSRILLDALSLLDPDAIPIDLFEMSGLGHPYGKFLDDPLLVLDAQEGLAAQSLVNYDYHSKSLSIHRLLQHVTFTKLTKDENRLHQTSDLMVRLIEKFVPEVGFAVVRNPPTWKFVEKTLSHIQSIYNRCEHSLHEESRGVVLSCLIKILNYAVETSQYALGNWAFQECMKLTETMSNPDHEHLSLVYLLQSRLCCETSASQDALNAILLSKSHVDEAAAIKPELLTTRMYIRILTNLGITHTALSMWEEGLKYHYQALETCKRLGMETEASIGNLRQNLAATYLWSGDLAKAEEVVREALGEPNANTEFAEYTLGNVLWLQGRLEEAFSIHKQVLQKYSNSLGADHPVTADSWNKMGSLLAIDGYSRHDLREAERCFRQSIAIWQSQAIVQDSKSESFISRSQWELALVLERMGGDENEIESLKKSVMDFLQVYFKGNIPEGKDISKVLEDIMFYWSR